MSDPKLDQDRLNMEIRKFLKTVGVTSQREIESALREAQHRGLAAGEPIAARMTLEIPALGVKHVIEHELTLT
jgi:hypothetical protein